MSFRFMLQGDSSSCKLRAPSQDLFRGSALTMNQQQKHNSRIPTASTSPL